MARIFRRYKSELHGNYRLAYLKYGLLTGGLLSLYLLVRHLISAPAALPFDYGNDVVLIVAILLSTYFYRKRLPDGKVTLKELLLLGIGMGIVAAVVYGLFVWFYSGVLYPDMPASYAEQFRTDETKPEQYAAALNPVWWAFFYGFLKTAVTSIIVVFFASIIFRTEKGEVRS